MAMKIEGIKPMMSDQEIEIIDNILNELKPEFCLEWGSGNSTLYFSKKPHLKQWVSVEHQGSYVKYLEPKLNSKTFVIWSPEDEWYQDCVKHSRKYDFILVDGLNRERCLEMIYKHQMLNIGGVALLHDSGRQEYQSFIAEYKGEKLCEGEEPSGNYYKHRGLHIFK